MKFLDLIKLSILNIKSNKFKSIIYLLVMLILFLLISITFTGTSSIFNFFDKQFNSYLDLKTISLKLDSMNKEKELNNIKSLNIKEVVAYYDDYYSLNLSLSSNKDFNFDNYTKPNIVVYEYLNNYNINPDYGRGILNSGEIICSSSFAPLGYVSDTKDILDISNKINNNLDVIYYQKYYPKEGESKVNQTYNKSFKLVGTYDIKEDLNYYNVCYISKDDYNEIVSNSMSIWEDDKQKILSDKNLSYNAYLIVNEYKNVNKVLNILKEKGYYATSENELDMDLYNLTQNILKYICGGILILLIIIIYLFIKNVIKENNDNINLYKLIGYNNKIINNIFKLEYIILTLMSFVIHLLLMPLIKSIIMKLMSSFPEANILTININYLGSILFMIYTCILIMLIFKLKLNRKEV